MPRLAPAILALVPVALVLCQPTPPLTNQRIADLARAGLSESELIRLIATAPATQFDLFTGSMDALMKAGVSEEVIKAMAARGSAGHRPAGPSSQTVVSPVASPTVRATEFYHSGVPVESAPSTIKGSLVLSDASQATGQVRAAQAPVPTDAEIQRAIDRGLNTPLYALLKQLSVRKRVRLNRTSFKDTVEKTIMVYGDLDRIALVASRRRQKLETLTVAEVRQYELLGRVLVRLESSAHGMYKGKIRKWAGEEAHMAFLVDGAVVNPVQRDMGPTKETKFGYASSSLNLYSRNSYYFISLYEGALYDKRTESVFFLFPAFEPKQSLGVIVNSADDHRREKGLPLDIVNR